MIDQIIEILKNTPHERVDIIFNSTARMPKGNPIPHIQRTHRDLSRFEKMGLLVIVSVNRSSDMQIIRMMSDIVLKTAGIMIPQMRLIVNTHEEALRLVYADRAAGENSVSSTIRRKAKTSAPRR